jgi:hypothetical protein
MSRRSDENPYQSPKQPTGHGDRMDRRGFMLRRMLLDARASSVINLLLFLALPLIGLVVALALRLLAP